MFRLVFVSFFINVIFLSQARNPAVCSTVPPLSQHPSSPQVTDPFSINTFRSFPGLLSQLNNNRSGSILSRPHSIITAGASTTDSAMEQQSSTQPPGPAASRFRHVYLFLENVVATGRLGMSRPDHNPNVNIIWSLFSTLPWTFLIIELVWSCLVVIIARYIALSNVGQGTSTLSEEFWKTRLSVSKSVAHGVGWGLFALLGFFIADSAKRYFTGQKIFYEIRTQLCRIVRNLRQLYPEGTWHPGDHERIVAHIAALPIALKMSLRGEKDPEQLYPLLNRADADTVVNTLMNYRCTQVIRAYFSAAEDDGVNTFQQFCTVPKTPAGPSARFLIMDIMDTVDGLANGAIRIATVRPAAGYVNHLRIVLYIWLLFLPLSIVSPSGWFTILWSVLISYGVCMMFTIAHALNEPYGFDAIDINLNMMCGKSVKAIMDEYLNPNIGLEECVDKNHKTPTWLEQHPPRLHYSFHELEEVKETTKERALRRIKLRPPRRQISIAMAAFTIWCIFIVILIWRVQWGSERADKNRWWGNVYIPVDSSTTSFVALGLFLLLSFWLFDAYSRYWGGLQSWQSRVRPGLENVALQFAVANHRGTWHERDRERIFSLLAAVPYAAKIYLRNSVNDVRGLEGILSEKDMRLLLESPNPLFQVFNMLYAYLNSADAVSEKATTLERPPYGMTSVSLSYALWGVEDAFDECIAIKEYPISPSFTLHLRLFTIFWMALLPLTLVLHDGFILFLFVLPMAYAILNLLVIGDELADPFGYDEHDIPLDQFCIEISESLHRVYYDTNDMSNLILSSDYDRSDLMAKRRKAEATEKTAEEVIESNISAPTMFDYVRDFCYAFPRVPISAFIGVTLWAVVAVVATFLLSRVWDDERNKVQYGWVSPIDVDPVVLGNVGFALFLILVFRAKDGMSRYDDGAANISEIGMHLRNFAVQAVQMFAAGSYHRGDKERLIAHVVQIPLYFRDLLLGIERSKEEEKEGLLSDDDRKLFEGSPSPLEHLINTVHAYAVIQDNADKAMYLEKPFKQAGPSSMLSIMRLSKVRTIIAEVISVKRFPVVHSYKHHQHFFTLVWLLLLPLSMTPKTGWLTIIWCPLIAYGILALEEIASKLVDPFGNDVIDIPVDRLCTEISNSILEGVNAVRWQCDYHTQSSPNDMEPGIGAMLKGHVVEDRYTLNYLDKHTLSFDIDDVTDDFPGSGPNEKYTLLVNGPQEPKIKPTLLSHFIYSVPWKTIFAITAWTTIACLISYVARKKEYDSDPKVRWWVSFISVDESVGSFLSIGTFALLGFYTSAAFNRYQKAGSVWGDKLRSTCHILTSLFLSYAHHNAFHEADHERIVGHLAAIPLVLKSQLRDRHDLREVRGFLSNQDVGRIQCAPNMALHCVDVLRSYMLKLMCHPGTVDKQGWPGPVSVALFLRENMEALEDMIRLSFFLKEFPISFAALNLLNTLLTIWFIVLPFVLAEKTGWFTILWTPFIAYGLMGMYSVAQEIQNPFGTDLNDFDLDTMAKEMVTDIVSVWKSQKHGFDSLITERPVADFWKNGSGLIFPPTASAAQPEPPAEKPQGDTEEEDSGEEVTSETQGRGDSYVDVISSDKKEDGTKEEVENSSKKNRTVHLREKLEAQNRLLQPALLAANAMEWWMVVAVVIWSTVAVVIAYFVGREFTSSELTCDWFCSHIALDSSVKKYIGYALFLLLGLRLHDSHTRYMSANDLWYGYFPGLTLVSVMRILQTYTPGTFHPGDIERILGHFSAIPICLMGKFHHVVYKDELLRLLGEDDVNAMMESYSPIDRCYDVLWAYMRASERFVKNPNEKSPIGFWEHRVVCKYIQVNKASAAYCKQIVNIPLPYGYVRHLRIFLFIWIMLLPLGLVESSGWVTILWVTIISYGVIAIERWATELSNPFGFDVSDVNIHSATNGIVGATKGLYKIYTQGLQEFIRSDRPGLEDNMKIAESENPVDIENLEDSEKTANVESAGS